MVENRFKWFEHVERILVDSPVGIVDQMQSSEIFRGKGRLRETTSEVLKKYLEINNLNKNMV